MEQDICTNGARGWSKDGLTNIIGGKWIVEPSEGWRCWDFAITDFGIVGDGTLFIAIDEERWARGSGNTGVYAGWSDTHTTLPAYQNKIVGAVVERFIEGLNPSIPQLLVDNSYDVIKMLGVSARADYSGKIVAITGTVGKTTTKMMIDLLLRGFGTVESTYKNHNSRTGVALTLGRCSSQPDFLVLEIALAALWMRSGGICKIVRPHVSVITEIALGQTNSEVYTVHETARMKARIALGIEAGGIAVINHDMQEFDFVKSEVISHGATPLSYGFNEAADIRVIDWTPLEDGSLITAKFGEKEVKYRLPAQGKGMISNSLAALSSVYALGLDPSAVTHLLEDIRLNESVLEPLTVNLPSGGKVYMLDDSHNAEVASMFSAFEVFKLNAARHSGKKICVLGRIVNLGVNAETVHRQLAKPLLETGVDLVFAYGDEMRYLVDELPKEKVAGYYMDIEACAQEVSDCLESDDYILLKGSRRANDFGQIRSRLIDAIKRSGKSEDVSDRVKTTPNPMGYGLVATDADSGELLLSIGNPGVKTDRGLGSLLLMTLIFESISLGKMKLEDYITIGALPASESRSFSAIGFGEGERLSLHTLLSLLICQNAPDAALALAEKMSGKTTEALKAMKRLSETLGLGAQSVENITGRQTAKIQSFNLEDLTKIGQYLFAMPSKYLKMLGTTLVEHRGKLFSSNSSLLASGDLYAAFFLGRNNGEAIAMARVGERKVLLSVCGARDNFHRDYLLAKAIERLSLQPDQEEKQALEKHIALPTDPTRLIQFIGDTYFGEDYTLRRQRRGEEDALTKYGYDYSFEILKPYLAEGHVNVANFEGVLTDQTESKLDGIKPYVLGGRIENSIHALKRQGINVATLGNNHAMDYDVNGLRSTLKAFQTAEIKTLGAGLTGGDASEPLRLILGDREILLFSGYWYRQPAHMEFDSYALGKKPGVACLNGELIDRIMEEKRRSKTAYIVLIAHWGVDYGSVMPEQRNYAKVFIESGVDLIIGHGAHMMQQIEKIQNKWTIYSIGNGVFNSNGEYAQRKVPPYGFAAQLRIGTAGDMHLRLHPLYTDNLKTFWQPCFVTDAQFKEVMAYHMKVGSPVNQFAVNRDHYGHYLELTL
jgi:UDP-N-acetylmuramyl pentapeptide synthase